MRPDRRSVSRITSASRTAGATARRRSAATRVSSPSRERGGGLPHVRPAVRRSGGDHVDGGTCGPASPWDRSRADRPSGRATDRRWPAHPAGPHGVTERPGYRTRRRVRIDASVLPIGGLRAGPRSARRVGLRTPPSSWCERSRRSDPRRDHARRLLLPGLRQADHVQRREDGGRSLPRPTRATPRIPRAAPWRTCRMTITDTKPSKTTKAQHHHHRSSSFLRTSTWNRRERHASRPEEPDPHVVRQLFLPHDVSTTVAGQHDERHGQCEQQTAPTPSARRSRLIEAASPEALGRRSERVGSIREPLSRLAFGAPGTGSTSISGERKAEAREG